MRGARHFRFALLALVVWSAGAAHAQLQVLRVLPEPVRAEPDPRGWRLNFDVIVENTGSAPVAIDYIELEAFDADGALVTRVHMGGGGLPPAIDMLPRRLVAPRGRLHLFNPFETLPADLRFETLRLSLHHDGGRLTIPITPVRSVPFVLPVMPLAGEVFVESGADLRSRHRRVSLTDPRQPVYGREHIAERHALELTRIDDAGGYRDGPREAPESWYAWDLEVRSPARGEVVFLRDDIPDNVIDARGALQRPDVELDDAGFLFGNHVVLEIAPDVHLVLAHLKAGSVEVNVGDTLWEGALVGRVGLSGQTTYPHLQVHLQRGRRVLEARPLPLVFACVRDLGGTQRRPAFLTTGDRIRPCVIGEDGRRLREP